ncbi:MAG: radical SAM protein [Candidatus Aenigmatarchaeota archaeon]
MHDFLSLEVTGKCNLECKYCCRYGVNNQQSINNELDKEDLLKIITQANDLNIHELRITGGEPFLSSNLFEIINNFDGSVKTFTNGTLLNKKQFKKIKKSNLQEVTVSLDGLKNQDKVRKGSNHIQILDTIRTLNDIDNLFVSVNTILGEKTLCEIQELYKILREIDIEKWILDFPQDRGRINNSDFKKVNVEKAMKKISEILLEDINSSNPIGLKIRNLFNFNISEEKLSGIENLKSHPSHKLGRGYI